MSYSETWKLIYFVVKGQGHEAQNNAGNAPHGFLQSCESRFILVWATLCFRTVFFGIAKLTHIYYCPI